MASRTPQVYVLHRTRPWSLCARCNEADQRVRESQVMELELLESEGVFRPAKGRPFRCERYLDFHNFWLCFYLFLSSFFELDFISTFFKILSNEEFYTFQYRVCKKAEDKLGPGAKDIDYDDLDVSFTIKRIQAQALDMKNDEDWDLLVERALSSKKPPSINVTVRARPKAKKGKGASGKADDADAETEEEIDDLVEGKQVVKKSKVSSQCSIYALLLFTTHTGT